MLASPISGAICSIPIGRASACHVPGASTGPSSCSSARPESLYSCVTALTPFAAQRPMKLSSPPAPEKGPVNPGQLAAAAARAHWTA